MYVRLRKIGVWIAIVAMNNNFLNHVLWGWQGGHTYHHTHTQLPRGTMQSYLQPWTNRVEIDIWVSKQWDANCVRVHNLCNITRSIDSISVLTVNCKVHMELSTHVGSYSYKTNWDDSMVAIDFVIFYQRSLLPYRYFLVLSSTYSHQGRGGRINHFRKHCSITIRTNFNFINL